MQSNGRRCETDSLLRLLAIFQLYNSRPGKGLMPDLQTQLNREDSKKVKLVSLGRVVGGTLFHQRKDRKRLI